MTTRRQFMTSACAIGAAGILSVAAHAADEVATETGEIVVHPIQHASFVMETPNAVIYVDPVGDPALYDGLPEPDIILITHVHGDHFDPETLAVISTLRTQMMVSMTAYDRLPPDLQARSQTLANGETKDVIGIEVEAVPAYNITEGRLDYHPQGRDNGYVFEIDGRRIYVAGDTEGTDEMRALDNIHLAFVPMNLPYTMDAAQAADAVAAFAPQIVYPYHYRGEDGEMQDPEEFARLLREAGAETEVRMGDWYGEGSG